MENLYLNIAVIKLFQELMLHLHPRQTLQHCLLEQMHLKLLLILILLHQLFTALKFVRILITFDKFLRVCSLNFM